MTQTKVNFAKEEKKLTIQEMEKALLDRGFFVGALPDEVIRYYYNKLIA